MKKLVISTIAAAMLTTAATAEVKVGLGVDVLGSGTLETTQAEMPTLRVSIDGLMKGLRIEPRFNLWSTNNGAATATKVSALTWGIGAYYDVVNDVALGLTYVSKAANSTTVGTAAAVVTGNRDTNLAVSLKAEKELAKNFAISYEVGYQFPTNTAVTAGVDAATSDTAMYPYSSVTMRLFF